ncbi:unnamed protein product, partial [Polarella glacialis]
EGGSFDDDEAGEGDSHERLDGFLHERFEDMRAEVDQQNESLRIRLDDAYKESRGYLDDMRSGAQVRTSIAMNKGMRFDFTCSVAAGFIEEPKSKIDL